MKKKTCMYHHPEHADFFRVFSLHVGRDSDILVYSVGKNVVGTSRSFSGMCGDYVACSAAYLIFINFHPISRIIVSCCSSQFYMVETRDILLLVA